MCCVTRSLDTGGAERQLVELVRAMPASDFSWTILTFYGGGALEREVATLPNVRLRCLGKRGRWDVAGFLWRLVRAVRRANPDVVHGSLGVANEAALLAGRLARRPVVWRLGAASGDFGLYDWAFRGIFRVGGLLSSWPEAIIFNSCAGCAHHLAHGWSPQVATVVPNGFDHDRFRPDPAAGLARRREWGIDDEAVLIGIAARLDPIKDHDTFLAAAAMLARRFPDVRFVCVGDGAPLHRERLRQRAVALGVQSRMVWAGECTDMPAAYNALDIGCLTSLGEGLPNAVGEAMSCRIPCVVTDVGDCRRLVGSTGIVVPAQDPVALAEGLERLVALAEPERLALGARARRRIETHYGRQQFVASMSALLAAAATARSSRQRLVQTRERLRQAACHDSTGGPESAVLP